MTDNVQADPISNTGEKRGGRFRLAWMSAAVVVMLALVCGTLALVSSGRGTVRFPFIQSYPRVPKPFLREDVLRPMDRDIVEQFMRYERSAVSANIDFFLLKPYLDDVQTRSAKLNGLELTADSFPKFPELHKAVEQCSKILQIPAPRVFVRDAPGMNAYTTNMADPIIVLHSSVIRRVRNPAELRFIIGHEMGHIYGHHVKLQMILRSACKALPATISAIALVPFLSWSREAEMSADRAALICCQDQAAAEQALLRLLLNLPASASGRLDVDGYLAQQDDSRLSKFSDTAAWINEILSTHPFVPSRIRELRKYAQSEAYRNLW